MNQSWHITWNTYGTWLPGDPRGFQSWQGRKHVPPPKRYANGETETYNAADYKKRHEYSTSITGHPVRLTNDDRQDVLDAVVGELDDMPINPSVIAVCGEHIHLLAVFGEYSIRKAVGRLKSAATRRLKTRHSDWKRVWARNCHMKSVRSGKHYENVFRYVREHEEQGALVFVWGPH